MITKKVLKTLFSPTKAIREEFDFLSGRTDLIDKCLDRLSTPGVSLVLYGERGVGKTSVAYQLYNILCKKQEVIDTLGIGEEALEEAYRPAWYECTSETDFHEVLLKVLRPSPNEDAFSTQFKEIYKDSEVIDHIKTVHGIDLPSMTYLRGPLSGETVFHRKILDELRNSNIVFDLFKDLMIFLNKKYDRPDVVIFIDEFDRVKKENGEAIADQNHRNLNRNIKGLAPALKNIGGVRFVFVGVANSVGGLMGDHESVVRKILGGIFEVPGLSKSDLLNIFTKAEEKSGGMVTFSTEFKNDTLDYAYGFPWVPHHFGTIGTRGAMEGKTKAKKLEIKRNHFEPAVKEVLTFVEEWKGLKVDTKKYDEGPLEVLRILSDESDGLEEEELREKMAAHLRQYLDASLEILLSGRYYIPKSEEIIQVHQSYPPYSLQTPNRSQITKDILTNAPRSRTTILGQSDARTKRCISPSRFKNVACGSTQRWRTTKSIQFQHP